MRVPETNKDDDATLVLQALTWLMSDDARASRFLALTGIGVDDLRRRVEDVALLEAVIGFLEAHQPDLIACADALGLSPARLISARDGLTGRMT